MGDSPCLDLFCWFNLGSWEPLLRGLFQSLAIVPFRVTEVTSLVPFYSLKDFKCLSAATQKTNGIHQDWTTGRP